MSDNGSAADVEVIPLAPTDNSQTQRGLSPRHVHLMAIGGAIGTGLWVGIGSILKSSGPLTLLLGYSFWSIFYVWPLYMCVGEICAYLPVRGSIFHLASRFVDPAMGFSMGWSYFFASSMLVCTEFAAVATVIQYWDTTINPAAWVAISLFVCVAVNAVAVKFYGESEFVMAVTKVLLLAGLVLLTIITMSGGNPHHDAYGFRNWGNGNAILEYYSTGATGRFLGWWKVVIYCAFSIAGPDPIALAAAEIQNPQRTIPRVVRLVFYRVVGFYIIGVLCVGIICSASDPGLISAISSGASGAGASPWVVGIQNLGINGLPSLINALIMLSGWSCGNAYMYTSSRTLYGLAKDGQAPKFLAKCTKSGVPIYSVLVVTLITSITFLVPSNSAITVFLWFIDLTTGALVVSYTMMLVTYVGFYRARTVQGLDPSTLPYQAPFGPWIAYVGIFLGCLALLTMGWNYFVPFDKNDFVTSYFALAFGFVTYFGWKIMKRTKLVNPAEADLIGGKKEIDDECRHWEEGGLLEVERERLAQFSFARRCWERLW
ncbi:proline permease [Thozetella sp. PMI_491]|nr:proline permease [Thozetella sp. PMI_491]